MKPPSPLRKTTILGAALALVVSASAATVDWNAGSWDNGSGFNTGYDNGAANGSTVLTGPDFGLGITVNVNYALIGTTVAGASGGNGNVDTTLNGSTLDPSFHIQTQTDGNGVIGNPLVNYAVLTFNFSGNVQSNGSAVFTVYDIDKNLFSEFVTIEARSGGSGGTLRTVSYTTSAANTLATQYSQAGVLATGNAGNSSDDGNSLFSIAGNFDYIRLIFAQQEGNSGIDHGIGISDLTVVPEPSALALAGLGIAFAAGRRVRRQS